MYIEDEVTYNEARTMCKAMPGYRLVSFPSWADRQALAAYLDNERVPDVTFWIGLFDIAKTGILY